MYFSFFCPQSLKRCYVQLKFFSGFVLADHSMPNKHVLENFQQILVALNQFDYFSAQ